MLQKLVLAMRPLGYEPTVVSLTGASRIGEELQDQGISVVTLGGRNGILLPSQMFAVTKIFRRCEPDVVHCWMYHANLVGYGLMGMRRSVARPLFVTSVRAAIDAPGQERMSVRFVRRLDALFSGRADAIVFNSYRGAEQHAAIGYQMRQATVIHNFFDTDRFKPRPEDRQSVRLSLAEDRFPLVALVGRFDPLKGHLIFLQAAKVVKAKCPESQFLLLGRGCESTNVTLSGWIRELDLVGAVSLLGERRDVAQILSAVDLAVSSSLSEGFSNVIGEAMACGTPCVVTDVGDSAHLVGDSGLVVPPGDPVPMAKAIIDLTERPADARQALGERARQRIISDFGTAPIVGKFADLYKGGAPSLAWDAGSLVRGAVYRRDGV